MIDLDQMKSQWTEEARAAEGHALNRDIVAFLTMKEARTGLEGLSRRLGLEAAVWSLILLATGGFTFDHRGELRYLISGVALHLYGIGMLGLTIREILAIRTIDYSQPVTVVQSRLERLGMLRSSGVKWAVLLGIGLWAPALMVACRAVLGLERFPTSWLLANVIFGLACIPLTLWVTRRFASQMERSPFWRQLADDVAGRNVTEARKRLASIADLGLNQGPTP